MTLPTALDGLLAARAAATEAAESLARASREGRPLDQQDIASLQAYESQRAGLSQELALADGTVDELEEAWSGVRQRRSALQRLADLKWPDFPNAEDIRQVVVSAAEGGELDREVVDVLLALAEMVEHGADDAERLSSLVQRAGALTEISGLMQAVSFAAAGLFADPDDAIDAGAASADAQNGSVDARTSEELDAVIGSVASEPVASEPVVVEPVESEPVVSEPVASKPPGPPAQKRAKPAPVRRSQDVEAPGAPASPTVVVEPTEPRPAVPAVVVHQVEGTGRSAVTRALADLVEQRRDGLAMHLAEAAGMGKTHVLALRALALSSAPVGLATTEIRQDLEELATTDADFTVAERLLMLAAALPIACAAPHMGAAQVITEQVMAVATDQALSTLLSTVGELAARGITIDEQILGALGDVAERERRVGELRERAKAIISHPPTLNYPRASELLREQVCSSSSELGRMLQAIVDDDDDVVDEVAAISERLIDRKAVGMLLDSLAGTDRKRTKRKPIVGNARERFVTSVLEFAELGREWAELHRVSALMLDDGWLAEGAKTLRTAAGDLLATERPEVHAEELVESAALHRLWRAARILATDAVEGRRPERRAADPAWLLGSELLRDSDIRLSHDLRPLAPLTPEVLLPLVASPPSWPEALLARAARGDVPHVERLLTVLAEQGDADVIKLEDKARHRLEQAARSVEMQQEQVLAELSARFQKGALSASDWEELAREADAAGQGVEQSPGERADAYTTLRERITDAATTHVASLARDLRARAGTAGASGEQVQRLEAALSDEDVATAEHIVLALERGETLVGASTSDDLLERVFPSVANALEGASASALAEDLRSTGSLAAVDAPSLPPGRRERAADGLAALAHINASGEAGVEAVGRVLTLLGLNVGEVARVDQVGRWPAFDVRATVADKALVPQFGSSTAGIYRVLVLPNVDATEDLIASTLERTAGGPATILLHASSLPATVLRGVAERARQLSVDAQALLCDLSVCAAVAAIAPGSFECTARLTLPLTTINPYDPYLSGVVPEEMFYGRRAAVEDLIAVDGNIAFVYGGRRLGKSALLRAAERRAGRRDDVEVCFIDLKDEGVGYLHPPSRLLDLVEERFKHVLPASRKQQPTVRFPERVTAALEAGSPRMLVLLDEADAMIDADAQQEFRTLDLLRRLQEDTGKRIRFVFAGLHSVRRFSDIPNQRLVQFGRSEPIGALEGEPARELLQRPLRALGYRLEERSVNRILTLTQYQASLIQLVCDKLLRHLHSRTRSMAGPPYKVTVEDVDGVLREPGLQDQITERFNLTVRLDERYRVIALIAAYLAAGSAATERFEVRELRDQCNAWWPVGFVDTSATEFATLLDEMVGLGVLYSRDRRYGLYSPHVARLLGTENQIADMLDDVGEQPPPHQGFDGISSRLLLPPRRRGEVPPLSPFNLRQVARLQEARDGLHVIVGTSALAGDRIEAALEYHLGSDDEFEMLFGERGDITWLAQKVKRSTRRSQRVACIRAGDEDAGALASGLREIARHLARRGDGSASCKALVIVDAAAVPVWRTLAGSGIVTDLDINVTRLRRHTVGSLASWAGLHGVGLPQLESPESAALLLEATGGWPMLMDLAVAELRRSHDVQTAVSAVQERLEGEGAQWMLDATALLRDEVVAGLFDGVLDLDGVVPAAECAQLFGEDRGIDLPVAEAGWDLLGELGLLDISAQGFAKAEALVAAALAQTRA